MCPWVLGTFGLEIRRGHLHREAIESLSCVRIAVYFVCLHVRTRTCTVFSRVSAYGRLNLTGQALIQMSQSVICVCEPPKLGRLYGDGRLFERTRYVYVWVEPLLRDLPVYPPDLTSVSVEGSRGAGEEGRGGGMGGEAVVSSKWARDEDINRMIRSLPNWTMLRQGMRSKVADEEYVGKHALYAKVCVDVHLCRYINCTCTFTYNAHVSCMYDYMCACVYACS